MLAECLKGRVQRRLEPQRLDHRRFQVVANHAPGYPAKIGERAAMALGPVGQALAEAGGGKRVGGRAQNGDEDLSHPDLAGRGIDDLLRHPRIIGLHHLAGPVAMAKARARTPLKGPERGAEPSIRVAIRMALAIFLPQQGQRHALALKFGRDIRPVRLHRITPRPALAAKQRRFQHIIVGIRLRQRPYRKLRFASPIQIRRYRGLADPKSIRDLADRQTLRAAQRSIVRTSFTVTSLVCFRFGILISGKSLSMSRQNGAPD